MNKYSVPRYLYRITMKVLFVMLILAAASIRSVAQIKAAVAANMKFAFEDIKTAFSKKTGYEVISVYGSSGRLVSQIRNGAPFDLFISADTGFIDSICVSGLNAGKPEIYAFGKLVLWTVKSMDLSRGVSLLADSSIRTVAFGDMKLTVYGPAARDCLKKVDLWDNVKDKAVYASNISHVAQFIVNGSADIGFCAKSIVLSKEMNGRGKWIEIDSTMYNSLPQSAVILKHGEKNHSEITHALFDFLYSDDSRDILTSYGYKVP
ncbi:MAG: molybdate ABC transporter substrate-binding protein [Fibrobacter sp.]|nr:molybdate ABC transporter substrate-binding protein [Fibrobacter sp.]